MAVYDCLLLSRIHKTLRVTPAMEAGLTDEIMSIADVVKLAYPDSK